MSIRRRRRTRFTRTRRRTRRKTFGLSLRQNGFTRRTGYYGRYNTAHAANVPAFQQKVELKFSDTILSTSPISSAGDIAIQTLNAVSQGTGESDRIGRNIIIYKVMFKGTINLPDQPIASAGSDKVRFILYWDKQTNGTPATVAQILETTQINSFRNLANSKRFRILYDRVHTLNSSGISTTSADVFATIEMKRHLEWYVNTKIPIEFDSTTGGLSEMKSNNLGILLITNNALIALDGRFRIRYTG